MVEVPHKAGLEYRQRSGVFGEDLELTVYKVPGPHLFASAPTPNSPLPFLSTSGIPSSPLVSPPPPLSATLRFHRTPIQLVSFDI